jgi:hypothetical protein
VKGRVVLKIDALGVGTVEVDGHELGHLTAGVHVHTCPGELTRVVLDLVPDEVVVELDADVRRLAADMPVERDPEAVRVPMLRGRRAMTLRGPLGG